jgi:glycosyltransferase involved in cell wall biosynthesis
VDTLTVHDDNPEELTKAINTLISDEATRKKIISNGQKKVLEQFTTNRFVSELKEKFENCL